MPRRPDLCRRSLHTLQAHTSGKAISPHFEPVGKAVSEAGSDEKSATLGSLTDFGGSSLGSSLGAFDTRSFEIERKRQGAVQALGVVDTPIDDPRFNAITKWVLPVVPATCTPMRAAEGL